MAAAWRVAPVTPLPVPPRNVRNRITQQRFPCARFQIPRPFESALVYLYTGTDAIEAEHRRNNFDFYRAKSGPIHCWIKADLTSGQECLCGEKNCSKHKQKLISRCQVQRSAGVVGACTHKDAAVHFAAPL